MELVYLGVGSILLVLWLTQKRRSENSSAYLISGILFLLAFLVAILLRQQIGLFAR